MADRTLLLVGAGHAHISVFRRLAMRPDPRIRLIVVAPEARAPYSGMLPGYLAGQYGADALFIDVAALTERAGGWFLRAEVESVDPIGRRVTVKRPGTLGGMTLPPLAYDVASLNTGAAPKDAFVSTHPMCISVKPLTALLGAMPRIDRALTESARLAVVGAGAAGLELCFAMRRRHPECAITLIGARALEADATLAAGACAIKRALDSHRITLINDRVIEGHGTGLVLASGATVAADVVLVATPVAPPAWLDPTALPRAPSGFLAVDDRLAVTGTEGLYAAGDLVELPMRRSRSGVMAVRAGQFLADALIDAIHDRPHRRFRPQRRWLTLVNTCDGRAIGIKDRWSFQGRWVWWLKHRIDARFMATFSTPRADYQPGAMRCEGCAAKLPSMTLRSVLTEPFEDAAVVGSDRMPRVASIDGLSYLLSDPHLMGVLAVRHAVSDIWAMGGQANHGLALVAVTRAAARLEADELRLVQAGIKDASAAFGVPIVGGHSLSLMQPMVAVAVEGYVERPIPKAAVRPGDQLVISGPLGSGLLLAGFRAGWIPGQAIDAYLIESLRNLGPAARIAQQLGVHAMTDVTGFGLAGHLNEMLGDLSDDFVWASEVPMYEGARQAAAVGVRSSASADNEAAAGSLAAHAPHPVVFDPQTAGPLLAAIPAARAPDLIAQWQALGLSPAIIGRVTTETS